MLFFHGNKGWQNSKLHALPKTVRYILFWEKKEEDLILNSPLKVLHFSSRYVLLHLFIKNWKVLVPRGAGEKKGRFLFVKLQRICLWTRPWIADERDLNRVSNLLQLSMTLRVAMTVLEKDITVDMLGCKAGIFGSFPTFWPRARGGRSLDCIY